MLFASVVCCSLRMVATKGFLNSNQTDDLGLQHLGQDLILAMDEVLGCGGDSATSTHLTEIEARIRPMWMTMPSNDGKLDWKSLRYVAHRYFMQQSSMLIRGFEPSRALNESDSGAAEILSKQVPAHADLLFGGHHSANGYTVEDAIALLAALERLVFDSETALLERVYKQHGLEHARILGFRQTKRVLEAYMVHWMMGEDSRGINILLRNRTLLDTHFPRWQDVRHFVEGRIRTLDFSRSHSIRPSFGQSIMEQRYTFDDAHEIVGGITKNFQSYWESECQAMKKQLVDMDHDGTGRVRLSEFYGTGLEKDWRFGESEDYLRQLGVLDESSPWRGKQVIIPNYLQAASNCIVSAPHYLLCCINECENLMSEIERLVQVPSASPSVLLSIVGNLSSPSDPHDDPPKLQGSLSVQLDRISEAHGGQVPLHGRLFAQWLHYVFPRECPFPHKAGVYKTHTLTPHTFGKQYIASKQDMKVHADAREDPAIEQGDGEAHRLSQWSDEEELFADYSGQLHAPWERKSNTFAFACFVALVALAMWSVGVVSTGKAKGARSIPDMMGQRSHMV